MDFYKERLTELLERTCALYGEAEQALEAVDAELLEALTHERQMLLGKLRELSAEDYFGRGQEPWLLDLGARVRAAESHFMACLEQAFAAQKEELNQMGSSRKARRAYNSAA